MANPQALTLRRNTWTKVASGVTAGTIIITSGLSTDFIYTTRAAGSPAPTARDDATACLFPGRSLMFSEDASADIYVFYTGGILTGRIVVR